MYLIWSHSSVSSAALFPQAEQIEYLIEHPIESVAIFPPSIEDTNSLCFLSVATKISI